MAANMFNKAKESATKGSSKKNDKVIVKVEDPQFDKDLQRFAQLKAEMDALKSKLEIVEADFKPAFKKIFAEQYVKNGAYPESFIVTTKSGASAMIVPQDKYITPTEELFTELSEKYNGEVTEEITEYSLKDAYVQEYGDAISKAIQGAKGIPQEVKDDLISAKTIIRIKKGSITKAFTVGKGKVAEFISDINPVIFAKNPKLGE